ncbi:MAG: hypothetical protein PHO02_05930 [Candidatus Nanoarchaeia archaeon]|nr:hypothetical protein [Candidatus Nanoarchaeia archaeon]
MKRIGPDKGTGKLLNKRVTALENNSPDSFRFRNNNRKRIAQALKQARSGKKKDIKNKEAERAEKRKVEKANGCNAAMVYWQSPAGLCRT